MGHREEGRAEEDETEKERERERFVPQPQASPWPGSDSLAEPRTKAISLETASVQQEGAL